MKIKRLNLFGPPSVGKSRTAAKVFDALKEANLQGKFHNGRSVELVREYAKELVWQGVPIEGYQQLYVTVEQIRREESILRTGKLDLVVTDSPVNLGIFYADKYAKQWTFPLLGMCDFHERTYPSLNVILERGSQKYDPNGRLQTEEESKEFESEIYKLVTNSFEPERIFRVKYGENHVQTIVDRVIHELNNSI